MNNERSGSFALSQGEAAKNVLASVGKLSCQRDDEGHCITCSDEALQARVLRVDEQSGIAFVAIDDAVEEVDITLLDDVVPGTMLLVHGGVAIANLDADAVEVGDG